MKSCAGSDWTLGTDESACFQSWQRGDADSSDLPKQHNTCSFTKYLFVPCGSVLDQYYGLDSQKKHKSCKSYIASNYCIYFVILHI